MSDSPTPDTPAASATAGGTAGAPVAAAPRRGAVAPYVAAGVAVVLALFVWLLATRDSGDKAATASPLLGKAAPSIVGTGFRNDAFDLDDQRGSWVLVNFFSTTCIPCKIEHPELVTLSERHAATGDVSIVSITFDDRPANVRSFFEKYGGTWPVLLEDTGKIAISYGVTAVPESYLISPSGLVARKVIGGITADGVDALIARLEGR
jgi:cytochrome c biogenesis protein CcmG/thiol:disulfide interchange protein DsbE